MCTSLCVYLKDTEGERLLFGRNMDIEAHFGEAVLIIPREYPLEFRRVARLARHYAIMGTGVIRDGIPLFADAMNEKGVCMAGLHFPGNAVYIPPDTVAERVEQPAPFELIPYLLGSCESIQEVKAALQNIAVADIPFSDDLPNTPLHWHIAAPDGSLILEAVAEGIKIYDDVAGVLCNNPPYPFHRANLHRYEGISGESPRKSGASPRRAYLGETYELGLGTVGLEGDYTSPSRFVRAAILRRLVAWEALEGGEEMVQFFRVLGAVAVPRGCVKTQDGAHHATLYSCCMDTATLTYHMFTDQKITPLSVVLTNERCEGRTIWKAHP